MITINELFAGIGTQQLALKYANIPYEIKGYSEIDKNAILAHDILCGKQFNYGDITKIEKLEYADLWTYSFPCLTEDTLVLTENGYKKIVDIQIGEKVLTHTNTYQNVTNFIPQGEKEILKIKGMCFDEIKTTSNHKFLVRTMYRRNWKRLFKEPEWKEAGNLNKYDYLGIAVNQNSIIPKWNGINLNWCDKRKGIYRNEISEKLDKYEFWYIAGRYLGDGWNRNDNNGIIICCDYGEEKTIIEKLDILKIHYCISRERTCMKLHISKKEYGLFFKQFGKGAKNKFIPAFVLDLPKELLAGFLKGYFDADGCFTQELYKASSISRKLVYGIGQCIAKVYNRPYSIYKIERPKKYIIEGRIVNQNTQYQITFKNRNGIQDKAFYEDGYIWFPIQSIENFGKEEVFDISVEKDNSFTANGCIVHNCQDISTMWYKKENPESLGKRSVLLFEVKRLLLQALNNNTLPKYLMLENVKNLLSNKYKGYFLGWVQFLNEIGYNTYYSIENAKYHGVPQHRERVFAISIRKDVDNHKFDFYRSGDSGIRIKDILEHDVSDKYNLDERYIDSVIIDKNNTINKNEIISIGTVEAYNYLSLKKICSINGISPTIPCRQPLNWIYDYNENRIRSLTPKETWRSMGIKDRYFDIVENEFSNSTLYSLAGNAIAVNVMTNIFNKLFE